MTIYHENTARKPRDLPVSEAERAARVQPETAIFSLCGERRPR